MTVQELIDELMGIEDKSLTVRHVICEGDFGTEPVYCLDVDEISIGWEDFGKKLKKFSNCVILA